MEIPTGFSCFKGQYFDNPVEFRLIPLSAKDMKTKIQHECADIRVCRSDTQPAWEQHLSEYEVRFQGNNEQFLILMNLFTTANSSLTKAISCVYRTKRQFRVMVPFKFTEELKQVCSRMGLKHLESRSIRGLLDRKVNGRVHNVSNNDNMFRFVYNVPGSVVRSERRVLS